MSGPGTTPAGAPRRGGAALVVAAALVALGLVGLGATLADGLLRFRAAERSVEVKGLAERGFKPAEVTVRAPSVTDRQALEFGEQGNRLRFGARATVTVYTTQVDAVRKALGDIGELGRRGVAISGGPGPDGTPGGVQYVFDGLNAIKPAMIEEATRSAREAAERFAADSQSRLGKIRRATQGQFTISDRDASTPHIKRVRIVSTLEYSLQD